MTSHPLESTQNRQIISLDPSLEPVWRRDLERLQRGDETFTRASAGEASIRALQRLLIFLGYSTSTTGAFTIDGDFGRGTNRGIAQFQHEHGMSTPVTRAQLCYPCTWQTARARISEVPDVMLDTDTLTAMLTVAERAIEAGHVTFGRFEDALSQLNALDRRSFLTCPEILDRYGNAADRAIARVRTEDGTAIRREWVVAIIKQETAGVARPRFEQHHLSTLGRKSPAAPLSDLRMQSMSMGLGQIMGSNHQGVGAPNAAALFYAPIDDQVLYVARFLRGKASVVAKSDPNRDDFRALARFYNGPGYEKHFYHEKLERWFREFQSLA
jgi:peptidoglycan hydrolase-like protein with peptidoglycan-binding domain